VSSYPRAAGLPELRDAISAWVERRFGSHVDPDTEVLPVLGSKEIVFSLAQLVLDPPRGKDAVITTAPGYPIPERGTRFIGGEVVRLPIVEERAFLPDLGRIPEEAWSRAAILWINYPNNPTGAIAPLAFFEEAAERFAAEENIEVEWERIWNIEPILFDETLIGFADEAVREVSGSSHKLPSGPLHDAAEVARAGIPTVMLFVQSLRGLSHTKLEDTKDEHLELSVQALDRLTDRTISWIATGA
jgi:hypothetical protein